MSAQNLALDDLLDSDMLLPILTYHLVPEVLLTEDMTLGQQLPTMLTGFNLTIEAAQPESFATFTIQSDNPDSSANILPSQKDIMAGQVSTRLRFDPACASADNVISFSRACRQCHQPDGCCARQLFAILYAHALLDLMNASMRLDGHLTHLVCGVQSIVHAVDAVLLPPRPALESAVEGGQDGALQAAG